MTTTQAPSATRGGADATTPTRRADLQGLRGVAVLLVVLYHAGLPGLAGGFVGVDVFFVLSGFFIVGLLALELQVEGRVRLGRFWARRMRRLLPAGLLVLVATVVAADRVLPYFTARQVATDGIWAGLFAANWRFAQQQTDYLAADRDPSPLLHYWSLGVEEQFYLVVPVVVVLVGVLAPRRPRRVLVVVLAGVAVASLLWCVHRTAVDQPWAFFGTPARAWQLAAGGLLALVLPRLPVTGRRTASTMSLLGSALLAACVVGLSEGGRSFGLAYPSVLALGPTLATVLLVAGGSGRPHGLTVVLQHQQLTRLGDLSYVLYLWHWPVLVLGAVVLEDDGPLARLLLVCGALVAAVVTHELVEEPLRRARTPTGRTLIAGLVAVALTVGIAVQTAGRALPTTGGPATTSTAWRTHLAGAPDDEGPLRDDGCQVGQDVDAPDLAGCSYGDVDGDHELVLVGDSIAGSVFPAVEEAADRHGWRVRAWAKSSCTVADVTTHVKGSDQVWTACSRWRERVLAEIERRRPDLVVLAGSSGTFGLTMSPHGRMLGDGRERDQLVREGLLRTVERLRDGGTRLALVQSPHRARRLVPDCLAAEGDPAACSFTPRDETRHTDWVARQLPDLPYLRVADAACPGGRCRAVVGDTIVYRDKLHFTTRFARTLVPLVVRAAAS